MFSLVFNLTVHGGGNKEHGHSAPKDGFKQRVTAGNAPGHKVQFESCIF